ncbi:hypothetical protein [Yersinia hibernica]|uniref:Uncharacterized protein n=1 Tax=Yersinia enterocolitica LC20 TaxID=1443113 RepID=A0A7U4K1L2_YEREN|nr:hypothetical protein [Yersinia hibernica]AHM74549.1 hypothetical protein LC20_03296 [Yersinia hibernica]
MSQKAYSSNMARKAQEEYCQNNGAPHFAPRDGICFRCKKDIYQQHSLNGRSTGITIEKAGNELVTYCPHCNRSYDD